MSFLILYQRGSEHSIVNVSADFAHVPVHSLLDSYSKPLPSELLNAIDFIAHIDIALQQFPWSSWA